MAQMEIDSSKPDQNLTKGGRFIAEAARRGSDLICFPEMWTSGFPWNDLFEIAQRGHEITTILCGLAREYKIWINGSLPFFNENGRVANTSLLIGPEGQVRGIYRKIHLFTFFHEERFIDAGNSLCIVATPFGRIGLTVCYDIRFPELFRTYAMKGVEIILSPNAFSYPRIDHWKILTRARAIENQIFFVGTNRVGNEDLESIGRVTYFGDSVIIGPWGETIVEGNEQDEQLLTATIDMSRIEEVRSQMNIFRDRRPDVYDLG